MMKHFDAIKRPAAVINLDPAAENFDYDVSIDIRDLISLEDAMSEMGMLHHYHLFYTRSPF